MTSARGKQQVPNDLEWHGKSVAGFLAAQLWCIRRVAPCLAPHRTNDDDPQPPGATTMNL